MTDTNHTDSVEAETKIATIIHDGKINGTSANEITRQVLEVYSQQVEEVVGKEREFIYRHIVSEEARNIPYDTEWKQGYLSGIDDIAVYIKNLTPNHQD